MGLDTELRQKISNFLLWKYPCLPLPPDNNCVYTQTLNPIIESIIIHHLSQLDALNLLYILKNNYNNICGLIGSVCVSLLYDYMFKPYYCWTLEEFTSKLSHLI